MNTARKTILIVEDSPSSALTYAAQLASGQHDCIIAKDGRIALEELKSKQIDCVLLDLKLPDMDGLEILRHVMLLNIPPAVVVVTGNASLDMAVESIRSGAHDYLVKPFNAARLLTTVQNALAATDMRRELGTLRSAADRPEFCSFIGASIPMQAVYRTIEAAAPSTASVFITGETGTGKELAAEALHALGGRRNRNFVALNCGALPKDLIESILFGHVKGAFTGAISDQDGAAASADGGTLFLDELGEMSPDLQTKLLRFIQTGTYQRVGDPKTRKANIRFIAAMNQDPLTAVRHGRLREDLYYRLHVVPIAMPPLRIRGEDILLIARSALLREAEKEGKRFRSISPEAEARLMSYGWPGNVRQLVNLIQRIVVLNDGEVVTPDLIPPLEGEKGLVPGQFLERRAARPTENFSPDSIVTLEAMERRHIENAIRICGGSIQVAAEKLGVSPSTIYRKKEAWSAAEAA